MTPIEQARATVAARLRKDAERTFEAARRIEAGEDDHVYAIRHELARLERESSAR